MSAVNKDSSAPVNKYVIPATFLALYLLLGPGPAAAGDWWQQGADFLKSLGASNTSAQLSSGEVAKAFRQALDTGTRSVVQRLGRKDGFNADPHVHIPLPDQLQRVKSALDTVGLGGVTADLELKLNRAAEAATPQAEKIFINAIKVMTFDDVMRIYRGPDDAATRYFQDKMTPGLETAMQPIVRDSLGQVGAIKAYDRAIARYRDLPFVPDIQTNLTGYVVDKSLQGIFRYLAQEEAAIRKDPARQTTALLKKVFGTSN